MSTASRRRSFDKIFIRDNYTCQYCGIFLERKNRTVDHIIPKSKGGTNLKENLVACCIDCNQLKADHDLNYFLEHYGKFKLQISFPISYQIQKKPAPPDFTAYGDLLLDLSYFVPDSDKDFNNLIKKVKKVWITDPWKISEVLNISGKKVFNIFHRGIAPPQDLQEKVIDKIKENIYEKVVGIMNKIQENEDVSSD